MDDSDKVLKMQPILPQRSSFTWNDVPSMLPSMQPQLRKLTYLNLHDCRLTMIQNLESLTSLRHLILTFNNIALIQGLSTLLQLEHLDLGYNDIRKIAGLSGLHALAHLSVNNNSVQSLKDLELLHTSVPKLRVLDVRGNTQLAHSKGYRSVIISQFDELEMLDGLMVEAKERKQAARTTSNFITVDTLKEHSFLDHESSKRYRHFIGKGSDKPLSYYSRLRVNEVLEATGGNPVSNNNNNNYIGDAPLRGSPSSQVTAGLSSDDMETLKYLRNNWEESVVELELDHQRIGQICNIARLVSLRKASFCNNELKKIEGLDNNLRYVGYNYALIYMMCVSVCVSVYL